MAKVTIYSTITCQYCLLAKRYLEKKGVPFTEVDITFDQAKADELIKKTGQNITPVFIVEENGGEKVLAGFDKEKLDAMLNLPEE